MSKSLLIILFVTSFISTGMAIQPAATVELKYSLEFILKTILDYKNLNYRPEIPLPELVVASKTSLKQFQDDVEPQWQMRPDIIINTFVAKLNKIYLLDEKAYYDNFERCMDDSLAHELTHYIQVNTEGALITRVLSGTLLIHRTGFEKSTVSN